MRESRERVRAALVNSGFKFPQQRITANLAPADLRKAGPGFDLAIAAALLAASDQLRPQRIERTALAGELALDGSIRPIAGSARDRGGGGPRRAFEAIAVPTANAPEAMLADAARVIPLARLSELVSLGTDDEPRPPPEAGLEPERLAARQLPDLADLRGSPTSRTRSRSRPRAATASSSSARPAPASRSPPGACPRSCPRSAARRRSRSCGSRAPAAAPRGSTRPRPRPFRAPHHTISTAGLVGGGSPPRAGEVTLAHRGVLFLDELAEFSREALEALRQPLEEGRVTIVRARHAIELPCRFMLVAASNPCPCGRGEESGECECQPASARRYRAKLSGALADRIEIADHRGAPDRRRHGGRRRRWTRPTVRERVVAARERQERPARARPLQRRDDPRRAARGMPPASRRPSGCSRTATRGSGSAAAGTTAC